MISQLKHSVDFKGKGTVLLFLLFLILLGMIFSLLLGYLSGILIWGLSVVQSVNDNEGVLTSSGTIGFMKTLQMINHAGTFLVPAIVFRWLYSHPPVWQTIVPKKTILFWIFLIAIVNFSISPFILWLQELNLMMHLPEYLSGVEQWMKALETRATILTESFITNTSVAGFAANLMILAILPAVGEELIFRGVLQPVLSRVIRNQHLAIILTGILFSAMHMQFYGFLPRFFLGVFFGYLVLWTKNIWTAIWAHFLNNATAVVVAFLADNKFCSIKYDEFGQTSGTLLIVTSAITILFIFLLYKYRYQEIKPKAG